VFFVGEFEGVIVGLSVARIRFVVGAIVGERIGGSVRGLIEAPVGGSVVIVGKFVGGCDGTPVRAPDTTGLLVDTIGPVVGSPVGMRVTIVGTSETSTSFPMKDPREDGRKVGSKVSAETETPMKRITRRRRMTECRNCGKISDGLFLHRMKGKDPFFSRLQFDVFIIVSDKSTG